jgi:hypothetical protein
MVRLAAGFRSEDEELGDFIGVEAADGFFEALEISGGGFDEEQKFGSGFNLALPAIDGGEAREDVDAGGEAIVDERTRDALSFVVRGGGGEDQTDFGGGYGHTGNKKQGLGYRVRVWEFGAEGLEFRVWSG